MFGDTDYVPTNSYSSVPMEEQLEALALAQRDGKVLHVGLSNETPWGVMKWLEAAAGGVMKWGVMKWLEAAAGGVRQRPFQCMC